MGLAAHGSAAFLLHRKAVLELDPDRRRADRHRFFYVDHTAPVEAIRNKLAEIAGQSKLWNGKVLSLQVSDCKETTIELRALVSANTGSALWDLRCEVREKLIDYLQRDYPGALPRRRYEAAETVVSEAGRPQELPRAEAKAGRADAR